MNFLLTDTNVVSYAGQLGLEGISTLVLPAGEEHKTLATIQKIWDFLVDNGATRQSVLINMGGGVITDMGGFAASTFMRGIDFVNIPTTLLAMVDAGTGGKTGFDYRGLKNIIGTFRQPKETIIDERFLQTLPAAQLLSGYAEMLKHGLIGDKRHFNSLLALDVLSPYNKQFAEQIHALIEESNAIKQAIISADPEEKGKRKILNFGHTIGHAIEELSLAKNQPLLHGYAVMYGMLAELYLSHVKLGLDTAVLSQMTHLAIEQYGKPMCPCKDVDTLIELMRHDKKNRQQGEINFTLLRAIGEPEFDQTVPERTIKEALDYLFTI
ncbi:MAG: 3-dehydroquinate synthase [Paludibacteraceae bacterium]|nr:3-dehydroquinate synthase [Paludibacteraceae bacterium]